MKLIKICHYRCSEYDGFDYFVAPDDITEEQVEKDIERTKELMKKEKEDFIAMEGKRPNLLYLNQGAMPNEDFPENMTIKEAKEKIRENAKKLDEWSKKEDAAKTSFASHFLELKTGYRSLHELDPTEIIEMTADWGHNHGEIIKYGTEDF
jgi:hypothetical protein